MKSKILRIYDFDNTIYDGNITKDFFTFLISKSKRSIILSPLFSLLCWRLLIGRINFKSFIEKSAKHLKLSSLDLSQELHEFWRLHRRYIKPFYWKQRTKDDIIISASPEFIIKPFTDSIHVQLVASRFDIATGKLVGNPCEGEDKVRRLNELGIETCDEFYTDSMIDAPVIKFSKKAFVVKNNDIKLVWTKS